MRVIILLLLVINLSACITKQTTTNSQGIVIEEKYVVERPLKNFIKKVEFE